MAQDYLEPEATNVDDSTKDGRKGRGIRVPTKEEWSTMVELYREKPTRRHLESHGFSIRTVRRAIHEGWPDAGLPALGTLFGTAKPKMTAAAMRSAVAVNTAMEEAERAAQLAEEPAENSEEKRAVENVISAAVKASKLAELTANQLLGRLENGEVAFPPEITPKIILQVMQAMDMATEVTERALKVQQTFAPKIEEQMGFQIGILLDKLTDEELQLVMTTGDVPNRLLDQRIVNVREPESDDTGAENKVLDAHDDSLDSEVISEPVTEEDIKAVVGDISEEHTLTPDAISELGGVADYKEEISDIDEEEAKKRAEIDAQIAMIVSSAFGDEDSNDEDDSE